jgi:hypothetical protein
MRVVLGMMLLLIPLAVGCGGGEDEKGDSGYTSILRGHGSEGEGEGERDTAEVEVDVDADADADADADTDCGSTHAMVGWVADMPSGAHATSGTATIIDDCTVSVTNFNFDGGGVVVQFYGGIGGAYGSGFAISEDIFGTPFSDETVTLTLPDEKTLDDMDGISVWCVEFAVSFTDAIFEAP